MQKPEKILSGKGLLLVEGADEKYFFIHACEAYELEHIQVMDFGGVTDLPGFLKLLKKAHGFNDVKSLAIVQDAETNAERAINDIRSALIRNEFPVPSQPFEQIGDEMISVEFGIFPGTKIENCWNSGTLEDLCLETVSCDPLLLLADSYVDWADKLSPIHHRHKARLHTYLSGKEKYIGLKIGEAARSGAWNWEHPVMRPFHELIKRLDADARI